MEEQACSSCIQLAKDFRQTSVLVHALSQSCTRKTTAPASEVSLDLIESFCWISFDLKVSWNTLHPEGLKTLRVMTTTIFTL